MISYWRDIFALTDFPGCSEPPGTTDGVEVVGVEDDDEEIVAADNPVGQVSAGVGSREAGDELCAVYVRWAVIHADDVMVFLSGDFRELKCKNISLFLAFFLIQTCWKMPIP